MKTEECSFEIDIQGNLIIHLKNLLKKDDKEIRFVVLKEHLPKLKEILK